MRVLLVDDELLVRDAVRRVLAREPDVVIVGESQNGVEALEAIQSLRPDAVFLDVQMPGLTGVELLAGIPADERPATVFVTAYDRHAVRAFELNAIDYVLKPFDDQRVRDAVQRLRERLRQRLASARGEPELTADVLRRLLGDASMGGRRYVRRFVASLNGKLRVIAAADVHWIEADDNYVRLHTGDGSALVRETVKSLLPRLDPELFVRVHRSHLVALPEIRELQPLPNGDYRIRLAGGAVVPMSRTYRDDVLGRLTG